MSDNEFLGMRCNSMENDLLSRGPIAASANGPGHVLPDQLCGRLEELFDVSLGGVRVHRDCDLAAYGARALARGDELFFAPGAYDTESAQGLAVLGHELAHVLQQRAALVPVAGAAGSFIIDPALEVMANTLGSLIATILRCDPAVFQRVRRRSMVHALFPGLAQRLARGLAPTIATQPLVIQQISFASGDMFSIAAAMLIDPSVKVAIYLQKQDSYEKDDVQKQKAQGIVAYYNEVVGEPRRYVILEGGDHRVEIGRIWPGESDIDCKEDKATEIIGHWETRYRKKIRAAMRVADMGTSDERAVCVWLGSRGLNPLTLKGGRLAVLWSRLSGKKGEIHLEHDTGYFGMFQLCNAALLHNDFAVIAGDPPYNPLGKEHRAQRYDDIALVVDVLARQKRLGYYESIAQLWERNRDIFGEPPRKPTFAAMAEEARRFTDGRSSRRVVNLTGFWEGPDKIRDAWCTSRVAQFRLYEMLERICADVKHLGFRSGNLEALALLGYTVRYMEEPFSVGAHRMTQWHGKTLGYERIVVSRVPTRSGQFLVQQRMEVIAMQHAAQQDRFRAELAKVQPRGENRDKAIGRLQRAGEILRLLDRGPLPRALQPYFHQARRRVLALGQGVEESALPRLAPLPDLSSQWSFHAQFFGELHDILGKLQPMHIAKHPLTKARAVVGPASQGELGTIMILKNLKRVEWVPSKVALKHVVKELTNVVKPKEVHALAAGFLVQDWMRISEYLASDTRHHILL